MAKNSKDGGGIVLVIFLFALCVLSFWLFIIVYSYIVTKRKGGELKVDNDRDINPRHFSNVLRNLYKPVFENVSRTNKEGNWYFSELKMHRRKELVGLYKGNLLLDKIPHKMSGIVVEGSLIISDNILLECDIWCLGNVIIGSKCSVRSIAADGYIKVGSDTTVKRWLDAGASLYIEPNVRIYAGASAVNDILISPLFKGGKMYAPKIKITTNTSFSPEFIQRKTNNLTLQDDFNKEITQKISYWNSIKDSIQKKLYSIDDSERIQWIKEESINSLGDYYAGSNTVILHDIICKGSVHIRPNCIIVGSIHADKDLYLGQDCLVIGSVACENLYIGKSVVITSAVHVSGDALINEESVIGQTDHKGGLAVIGSMQFKGNVTISHGVYSGEIIYTV